MKKITGFIILAVMFFISGITSVYAVAGQKTWADPKHIDVYIQPGFERSTMMKHAFQEWTKLTKNKMIFYFIDNKEKSQIEVKFVKKVPTFGKPTGDGVAGLTQAKYTQTGEMMHAIIWIPTHTLSGHKLTRDEVYTSMLHEIGHAMGIVKHSTNKKTIMYPDIDSKREITKYDLGELYRMYGWKWDY